MADSTLLSYYYLLFTCDPTRELVRVWPDGDEDYRLLSFEEFLQLTRDTIGPKYSPRISESMNSYGVYWELDRENLRLARLSAASGEIENRQKEINEQMKLRSKKRDDANINPAESLAGVTPIVPGLDNIANPFDQRLKPASTNKGPSVTIPR